MEEPWKSAEKNGLNSFCAFPLKVFGKLYGALFIYSEQKMFFDEEEVRLIDELTDDISFCIETIINDGKRKTHETKLEIAKARLE